MAGATMGMAFRHFRGLFGGESVVALEDGQLLARFEANGDEAAFEALVGRHGPMVLTICRAVLRNEQDVEDAFQATFMVLARKARSIRKAETLGGWLHRVAYRASVQASVEGARRRRKEAEAAMARKDASGPDRNPELAALLHEEIDRLPERHRLPVVLCDLEGLTYEQAAERLRWTVPTLRCRLAKAREKLKARLTRRGLAPPAAVPLFLPNPPSSSVPPALLKATVLAATGGSAPLGAALLTHTLLRGMLMTKIKIASVATLSALALASAGVIAFGAGKPKVPDPAPMPKMAANPAVVEVDEPAGKPKPVETVEVKGRVVSADGKPVAGATVRGMYVAKDTNPWPTATSGPDGRFAIRLPKPVGDKVGGFYDLYPWLIASAPGHGVGWTEKALRADRPDEQVVKLAEEGPPIEGRVVDLEGRPVVGARVEATSIWFDEKGNLPGWIAKARNGAAANLWQGLMSLSLDPIPLPARPGPKDRLAKVATSTGPDGRFKLTGVGRDRIASLIITGQGVATTEVHVLSRDEPEIRTVERAMMRQEPFIVHAPKFQVALAPSKRVEGTIRDKDTGKPIAGIEIRAAVFDEHSLIPASGIEVWTDAEGRYRIDGLPRAEAYRLFTKPEQGQPYLNGTFKAPARSPGLDPVAFDIALKRGVIVRGRVSDKVTGRPISGNANYYAFADNPHLKDYPGFSSSYPQYAQFDEDGRYEVVALPGRGLILVRDDGDRYRPATGFEKIQGYDAKFQGFHTVPHYASSWHAAIAEVVVDEKSEGVTLDLTLDPGKSVPVEVVGPDGAPLGGTKVKGLTELFQTGAVPQESSGFEVRALDPGKPRRVIVMHDGRKLIGSALLKGDEPGPVTIKLEPWGSVSGRIVDDEGKPRKAVFIGSPGGSKLEHPETHDILPGSDWNSGIRAGDDGRFAVEGLVPGLKYDANARVGFEVFGDLFKDVVVNPGESKDLGDLKVQPPKKQED